MNTGKSAAIPSGAPIWGECLQRPASSNEKGLHVGLEYHQPIEVAEREGAWPSVLEHLEMEFIGIGPHTLNREPFVAALEGPCRQDFAAGNGNLHAEGIGSSRRALERQIAATSSALVNRQKNARRSTCQSTSQSVASGSR
jgi:hypothetical protein